ncbi:MAG TPA: adenylate/guanylate cyclase domain-containing protein [Chitinophagaceae bacterium]|nr:adenylate/guanylate cyclase domain-containing protein [Chitinophagaceae bacterium]
MAGLLLLLVIAGQVLAQDVNVDSLKALLPETKEDSGKVDLQLQIAKALVNTSPDQVLAVSTEARDLATRLGYLKGEAYAYKYIGIAYYYQSNPIGALENWNRAIELFQQLGDHDGVANIQYNIGAIYKDQGKDSKALEFFFNSLRNSEQHGDTYRIASAMNNIGSVYGHKENTYDKALEYYLKALPMSEQSGDQNLVGTISGNIGEFYLEKRMNPDSARYYFIKQMDNFRGTTDYPYALYNMGRMFELRKQYDSALVFEQRAYDSARLANSLNNMVYAQKEMARIYLMQNKVPQALATFQAAQKLARQANSSYDLKDIYAGLAQSFARLGNYGQAFRYQQQLLDLKDSIYNREADQKLASYELDFEMEKKQNQINILQKDKALQELEVRRQKFAKNAFLAGFGMILVLVFVLYRNYRNKVRVNRILDSQKAQIETLLLNILPAEVAQELQTQGAATPRYYENVTVLFTDFKGFTRIADALSPQEVVSELSACFMAFDEVIEKYGLEKIKTIGDAYMCAGGIPARDDDHAEHIVRAALEIREYIRARNEKRRELGLEPWEIRIGIHTGPLVAGVVGRKKYAYDIWGSTVNIASRMESNGEPGKINISSATYELVRDQFACIYRGKISAKNIGEIDMYFLDHPLDDSGPDHHHPQLSRELISGRLPGN